MRYKVPVRFGGEPLEKGHLQLLKCSRGWYLAGGLPYHLAPGGAYSALPPANARYQADRIADR